MVVRERGTTGNSFKIQESKIRMANIAMLTRVQQYKTNLRYFKIQGSGTVFSTRLMIPLLKKRKIRTDNRLTCPESEMHDG